MCASPHVPHSPHLRRLFHGYDNSADLFGGLLSPTSFSLLPEKNSIGPRSYTILYDYIHYLSCGYNIYNFKFEYLDNLL
jgi:hypothetical protein